MLPAAHHEDEHPSLCLCVLNPPDPRTLVCVCVGRGAPPPLTLQAKQGNKECLQGYKDVNDMVTRANGFAEVFPEHKFEIVKILQVRRPLLLFFMSWTVDSKPGRTSCVPVTGCGILSTVYTHMIRDTRCVAWDYDMIRDTRFVAWDYDMIRDTRCVAWDCPGVKRFWGGTFYYDVLSVGLDNGVEAYLRIYAYTSISVCVYFILYVYTQYLLRIYCVYYVFGQAVRSACWRCCAPSALDLWLSHG